MGSPPPTGSKKEVLKFRSVNNIVIPPAKTGNDNNNKNTVTKIDHTNKGIRVQPTPDARILKIVLIKLIAPKIEDIPAKCKLKIAISTEGPECPMPPDSGGYNVQPVPAPSSTKTDPTNIINAGGNNQKLKLFSLGNAISGDPIYRGTNQLPNPPINTGITKKKTIIKPCAVTTTLYMLSSPNNVPGDDNSNRIIKLKDKPTVPPTIPNNKYNVPISL